MSDEWVKDACVAVTVCDETGIILEMNGKARATFAKSGGGELIGKNLLDCHPPHARVKVEDLLKNPRTNAYTIEKNGLKKLIYQLPWHKDGKFAGLVELSMELPAEMPHFVRKPS